MPRKYITIAISAAMLIGSFLLTGCNKIEDAPSPIPPATSTPQSDSSETSSGEPTINEFIKSVITLPTGTPAEESSVPPILEPPKEPDIRRVHIVCAGDNLIHRSIYNQAARRAKKNGLEGYDFSYVYESVEGYIQKADIAILNQETVVTDEFEPSDYPRFCSPTDLGEHMINIGFNVFSLSNNHVLDKDEAGLLASLKYWDSHEDIIRYGAYASLDDMNDLRLKEVNGITFAFLGYTEHTNGLSLPNDSECRIVYLRELELIKQQIEYADSVADVVIVSAHYGKETINELTESQIAMTDRFFEWGADLVIGTQPHTAQSCEYRQKPDGSMGFVYYCLGNFVSAQATYQTLVGILGDIDIVKNMDTGEITVENPKAIPIITQYGRNYSDIHIVPYAEYSESLAKAHGCENFSIELIEKVLGYIPEEFLAIE